VCDLELLEHPNAFLSDSGNLFANAYILVCCLAFHTTRYIMVQSAALFLTRNLSTYLYVAKLRCRSAADSQIALHSYFHYSFSSKAPIRQKGTCNKHKPILHSPVASPELC